MRPTYSQQGFTLIELLLVIVIISVIAKMSSLMLAQGFKGIITSQEVVDANWQGEIALERMVRELRMVRSANDISSATSSQFSFVNLAGTTISYSLSGNTLMRNSQALADGISGLALTYYDQNGTAGPATSNIRYITIALTVTRNNANYTVNTTVFLRDLA